MTTINGIEMKTTFWNDFTIADRFGAAAVQDTYERAFKEWGKNVSYAKELVLVLNHKIWEYYPKNKRFAALYNELWKKADEKCLEYFSGVGKEEALHEYLSFLD